MRVNKTTVRLYATEALKITYHAYNLNKPILLGSSLRPLNVTMETYDTISITSIFLSHHILLHSDGSSGSGRGIWGLDGVGSG